MLCSSFICLLRWFICFVVSLFELVCVVCRSVTALCDDATMSAYVFCRLLSKLSCVCCLSMGQFLYDAE